MGRTHKAQEEHGKMMVEGFIKGVNTKRYSLEEVMTVSEACSRYNVTLDELKNRIKPSRIGQQEIDSRVSQGIIRKSGNTWLISKDFMELYFADK